MISLEAEGGGGRGVEGHLGVVWFALMAVKSSQKLQFQFCLES